MHARCARQCFEVIDETKLTQEFRSLVAFVKSDAKLRECETLFDLARSLNSDKFRQDALPNLLFLFDWILCIPLSNAEAERDFSKMKLIKTHIRNRLDKNLNNLMTISLHGPVLDSFDFEKAATTFSLAKTRRLKTD